MGFTAIPSEHAELFTRYFEAGLESASFSANKQEVFLGEEGLSFESLIDAINPLQQLPVVSTVYRALTDDTISTASRLAGGALFGGPLGFASALANVVIEGETGKDVGDNMLALLGDDNDTLASAKGFMEVNAYAKSGYQAYARAAQAG